VCKTLKKIPNEISFASFEKKNEKKIACQNLD
jgi:hypothetical protein